MTTWESDPAFADLRELAKKLEAAIAASNDMLLKAAGLGPDQVLPAFSKVQAKMLGFDAHAIEQFAVALEDKRVVTLAHGNLFVTCVLSAAVALSEFKKQPQKADGGLFAKPLNKLRQHSTNSMSLGAFAWASFYGVLGNAAWTKVTAPRDKSRVIRAR